MRHASCRERCPNASTASPSTFPSNLRDKCLALCAHCSDRLLLHRYGCVDCATGAEERSRSITEGTSPPIHDAANLRSRPLALSASRWMAACPLSDCLHVAGLPLGGLVVALPVGLPLVGLPVALVGCFTLDWVSWHPAVHRGERPHPAVTQHTNEAVERRTNLATDIRACCAVDRTAGTCTPCWVLECGVVQDVQDLHCRSAQTCTLSRPQTPDRRQTAGASKA
jgi:hypothetical protein